VLRRIALLLHLYREFSGRELIYFLLRLIFSDLGVDKDDDRRHQRGGTTILLTEIMVWRHIWAFCRALGEHHRGRVRCGAWGDSEDGEVGKGATRTMARI
jgi:hypothetical protein